MRMISVSENIYKHNQTVAISDHFLSASKTLILNIRFLTPPIRTYGNRLQRLELVLQTLNFLLTKQRQWEKEKNIPREPEESVLSFIEKKKLWLHCFEKKQRRYALIQPKNSSQEGSMPGLETQWEEKRDWLFSCKIWSHPKGSSVFPKHEKNSEYSLKPYSLLYERHIQHYDVILFKRTYAIDGNKYISLLRCQWTPRVSAKKGMYVLTHISDMALCSLARISRSLLYFKGRSKLKIL